MEEAGCSHVDSTGTLTAHFWSYKNLDRLYAGYKGELNLVACGDSCRYGGRLGPLYELNSHNCPLSGQSNQGEGSWNYKYGHLGNYTVQQERNGALDPLTEAGGHVFCLVTRQSQTYVWTQDDALILGYVTGPSPVPTYPDVWPWWREVSRALGLAVCGSGPGDSVPCESLSTPPAV
jgi:hypothetical protein